MTATVDKTIPIPRYHQLKGIIRRDIKRKKLQTGSKIGSLVKLAATYQVSKTTAAKAITELVDEGVLYSEIGNGTYVADPAGRKTHTICFVVHSADYITEPYFSQIIAGIGAVTEQNHYKLQFLTSERAVGAMERGRLYPRFKEPLWADGLIIMDYSLTDEQVVRLTEEFPVVLIDRKVPAADVACVRPDARGGTYQAISYLASLGHKRIGIMVLSEKWQADKEKLLGYQSAVRDLALDAEQRLIVNRGFGEASSKAALDALIDLPAPPTAIFVSDDMPAFKIVHRLREKGLRVPEDIAVMGFGGCLNNVLDTQLLTTMRLPMVKMGQAAAKMVLAMINKEQVTSKDTIFATRLAVGQSCGKKREFDSGL
ncbi:MAG: GntR family transcriptional regulator [Planctomycetota bacterium]|nr:GntR family transcriptional regulator [Planctomycetota bacterium]